MIKTCNKCHIEKELSEFCKNKTKKDGLHVACKECMNMNNKIWFSNFEVKEKRKTYISKNQEKINNYNKDYHQNNYEDRIKILHKNHYDENKKLYNNYSKEYSLKLKNIERRKKINKEKWKNNPNFKIGLLLRNQLNRAIISQNSSKFDSSLNLLNCTIDTFKLYLEQQFKPEMTWENHGEVWEIDHIKACSNFDLTKLEEQKQCFHYTNLQPLFKTTEIAEQYGYINEIGNRNKGTN